MVLLAPEGWTRKGSQSAFAIGISQGRNAWRQQLVPKRWNHIYLRCSFCRRFINTMLHLSERLSCTGHLAEIFQASFVKDVRALRNPRPLTGIHGPAYRLACLSVCATSAAADGVVVVEYDSSSDVWDDPGVMTYIHTRALAVLCACLLVPDT